MKRIVFISLVVGLVTSCASTYKVTELQKIEAKLDPCVGVLISVPKDGRYETTQYANSGRFTANAIKTAFSRNASIVDVIKSCDGENCLNNIDSEKYGYFVNPEILHWEERATEWSGKPDRIKIQIVVSDTKTKEELANSSYTGKSKWATFGGDHPQELLQKPTDDFVNSLYPH